MAAGHVYFIGAGPGAPDLITVRGMTIVERADVVIYADSLVDPAVCEWARPDAEVLGSSSLTLEEMTRRMIAAAEAGKIVARLQSGDPSVYGAIHEQIVRLDAAGVPWTIVPGVSSAFAAAAALGVELTVPNVAQTVILSRISGRASPVPPGEDLRSLAAHGTTLVLFLSIAHI
ncbi:MAG: precorrin-4 C(11)-methyltransferase, partial [Chloroflexi bacterium]|nr:precorrin-4 C(11)-methyltransferase [Chloroflexota bacterium]